MGSLGRSCAKVRELSELRIGVVRVVSRGVGVLYGGPRVGQGEGEVFFSFFLGGGVRIDTAGHITIIS